MNKYQAFCQKLLSGKIPHQRRFYIISDKTEDNGDSLGSKVKLITPTQSSVEKAKSEIKNEEDINISKFSDNAQTGGSSGKKRKNKPKNQSKRKTTKTSKGVSKKKSSKQNSHKKKKNSKRRRGKNKEKKSFRWM